MSVPVDVDALASEVARAGPTAFLVTTGDGNRPHVVSVRVEVRAGALVTRAGRTSRRNAAGHPAVTLLWPGGPSDEYCLLVDGIATAGEVEGELTVRPTGAIRHRLASASPDRPTCIPVAPAQGSAAAPARSPG